MRIGKGKIIKIANKGTDIMTGFSPLTLDNEVSLSLKSNFSPIVSNSVGKFMTVASNIARNYGVGSVTGAFKEMGFQVWSGTDPVSFSFDTTLNMKTSAYEDVLVPAKMLMNIPLPTDGGGENNEIGLVAPGPSIMEAFKGEDASLRNFNQYSIRIGPIYLSSIIIESVEPTWSMETDEDGYPIWCKLKIDVKSIFTATTQMIDDFGYARANTLTEYTYEPI